MAARKSSAQVAYEAYARAYPGQAAQLALPWAKLGDGVQAAWDVVAIALIGPKRVGSAP